MVRMTHPEHGYTHAYNGAELEALKKSGWSQVSEADFKKIIDAKLGKSESVEEAPKKRGPKPKAAE